jgi:hypothetical protein
MWRETLFGGGLMWVGLLIATILTTGTPALADSGPACTIGQERKIRKGLRIAPVPLDFTHKNPALEGDWHRRHYTPCSASVGCGERRHQPAGWMGQAHPANCSRILC